LGTCQTNQRKDFHESYQPYRMSRMSLPSLQALSVTASTTIISPSIYKLITSLLMPHYFGYERAEEDPAGCKAITQKRHTLARRVSLRPTLFARSIAPAISSSVAFSSTLWSMEHFRAISALRMASYVHEGHVQQADWQH